MTDKSISDQAYILRVKKFKLFSQATSVACAAIGCCALTGWIFNNPFMKSIIPGLKAMNPATAVCCILSGMSLFMQGAAANKKEKIFDSVAKACASIVLLIGSVKLASFFGYDLGVDRLLFREKLKLYTPVNSMAPNTAVTLILAGVSLLSLKIRTHNGHRPCEFVALSSLVICMLAFFGYIFGARNLYDVSPYIPMAVHTSIAFGLISIGVLFFSPENGLLKVIVSKHSGGSVIRRLLPILTFTLFLLACLEYAGEDVMRYYSSGFGMAVMLLSNLLVLLALLWWNAHLLNKADSDREHSDNVSEDNKRKIRGILDQTFQFIGVIDTNGILIEANMAALNFAGIKESDVLNKPFWETPWWAHSAELQKKLRASIKEAAAGKFVRFEATHVTKNGDIRCIDFSLKPVADERNRVIFIIPEGRDITEYKQMETELRQHRDDFEKLVKERTEEVKASQARYRRLFEASRDGIILLAADTGKVLDVNPFISVLLGFPPEHFIGKNLWDTGIFKDIEVPKNAFMELQEKGHIRYEDVSIITRNREIVDVEFVSNLYSVDHIKIIHCNIRDIRERKCAEEKLKASEESYRSIFESANDAVIIRDIKTYKVLQVNDKACEMFCYPKDEMVGLELEKIVSGSDQYPFEAISKIFDDIGKGGESKIFELPVNDKFGRQFWVEISLRRAIIGGRYCFLSIIRDITDRRRLIEAKNNFVNMVSHELRTPLGVIREGMALVLEGSTGVINEEQKEVLSTAKNNADRLSRLINQVLDFQKLDSGKMVFKFEEKDINEVIREAHKSLISMAAKKKLHFIMKLDDSIPRAKFDADKISEVVLNLLGNAIKFTDKGGITVATTCKDNAIKVSIEDTGRGIKEEDMSKLFQQFSQLKREPGGSGLGLAISKEIIEAHKGKIWVESRLGMGSIFCFVLPVLERRR